MKHLFTFIICGLLLLTGLWPKIAHAQEAESPKPQMSTALLVTPKALTYRVAKRTQAIKIDAKWDKAAWRRIKPLEIKNYMRKIPPFSPKTSVKMMYDEDNVYVIFRVKDSYVRSLVQEFNGEVSADACVEFFFAPDANLPEKYFNLEINAGGTPLLFYVTKPWTGFTKLDSTDIKKIEIAHSLPSVVDPEITEPITWTIEYRIPLSMLEKFSDVTRPKAGTVWRANFYKTASAKSTSNAHWMTWSPVDHPKPNFHLPEFFGTLEFE